MADCLRRIRLNGYDEKHKLFNPVCTIFQFADYNGSPECDHAPLPTGWRYKVQCLQESVVCLNLDALLNQLVAV